MILNSFYFKQKAKEAMKGNWQTALLVTFFSGFVLTVGSVFSTLIFQKIAPFVNTLSNAVRTYSLQETIGAEEMNQLRSMYSAVYEAIRSIPSGYYFGFAFSMMIGFLVTPVLNISASHYFVSRNRGKQLSLKEGLFSKWSLFGRSLLLYLMMAIRIFLWSLLLLIPGIIAALRYSLAPFYLAEEEGISPSEAIQKSKETMNGNKMSCFMLLLSFALLYFLISVSEMMLGSISTVFALVVSQFLSLFLSTYIHASLASFFLVVSTKDGRKKMMQDFKNRLRSMGMSQTDIENAFSDPDNSNEDFESERENDAISSDDESKDETEEDD